MESKDLTPLQRIEILEDVLRKLESGDTKGGLCYKIANSGYELLRVQDYANKIIPLFTFKNAKKVTEVKAVVNKGGHWWNYDYDNYDFENRIKFVKWMIEQEKLINNIKKQTI